MIWAAVLTTFAVILFGAAGFFYLQLAQIAEVCSNYQIPLRECISNESNKVAAVAFSSGVGIFSLTGLSVWGIAIFTAFKSKRSR